MIFIFPPSILFSELPRVKPVNSAIRPYSRTVRCRDWRCRYFDRLQTRGQHLALGDPAGGVAPPSAPTELGREAGSDRGQRHAEFLADPQHAQQKVRELGTRRASGRAMPPCRRAIGPWWGLSCTRARPGWVPLSLTSDLPVSSIEDDGL